MLGRYQDKESISLSFVTPFALLRIGFGLTVQSPTDNVTPDDKDFRHPER